MTSTRKITHQTKWALMTFGFILGFVNSSFAQDIRTTDYFINHQSVEPSYQENKLDPSVVIHVREVVLAGNERAAAKQGKVLLFLHGGVMPGYIAFDLDCCSMMRHFAAAGWDTFALDIEGYGLSSWPPAMDYPAHFKGKRPLVDSEVANDNVERVVEFISELRGIERLNILGWSLGASHTGPIYTIRNQDKVIKLVLYAPAYHTVGGTFEGFREYADGLTQGKTMVYFPASPSNLALFGSNAEIFNPAASPQMVAASADMDPRFGEQGGGIRWPNGRLVDVLNSVPTFDPSLISVPTLVIRGELDTWGTSADSRQLTKDLGSKVKEFKEIPGGSHLMQYETVALPFYKAVQDFLEAKVEE